MPPLLVIVHCSLRRCLFLGLALSGLVAASTQRELPRGQDGNPAALGGWATITRTSEFAVAVRLDASRQRGHRHRVRMWGRFDYAHGCLTNKVQPVSVNGVWDEPGGFLT